MKKTALTLLLLCMASSVTKAEDLKTIYDLAVANDPTLQAAMASMQANNQSLPKAIALMVPSLYASYTTAGNISEQSSFNAFDTRGHYNTKQYSLNLTQPIFHPEQWANLEQSRHVVKAGAATYLSTAQALIVRTTESYLSVLGALDDYDFTVGQRKAFAREYEQAKQRFDVGLIAITDVETAKARFDTAVADEISAKNNVADQYENLRKIVGVPIEQVELLPKTKKLPLNPPEPNQQEAWVTSAHQFNLDVIAAKENSLQYKAEIGKQASNHFPRVDLNGQMGRNKTAPPFTDIIYTRSVALNVNIPIFAGGGVLYSTKEAQARYSEALDKLEFQRRLADATTRTAFRGVLTAISTVEALAQAVKSNESSLKATRAAYEVGTRTIVDVLNAETSLLNAVREHSKARYNYLLQGLRLKQAAGTLTSEDLYLVNNLLTGTSSVND